MKPLFYWILTHEGFVQQEDQLNKWLADGQGLPNSHSISRN